MDTETKRCAGEPQLRIDLGALVDNFHRLQAAAGHAVGASVKADAYGLGAEPIARRLAAAGCTWFFVATTGEARALRATLPEPDIGVLSPATRLDLPELLGCRATPCVYSLVQLRQLIEDLRRHGGSLPIALHFDTGMHRLGLPFDDLAVVRQLVREAGLDVRLVMSHLACADDRSSAENRRQAQRFAQITAAFPGVETSLANSAGVFLGPPFSGGVARPGLALYGVDPHGDKRLKTVCTFTAPLLQIRELVPGDRVGYGGLTVAPTSMRLGVMGAGYADGVCRALGEPIFGQAWMACAGTRVPVFGRVSMDLATLDVTDVPGVQVGDPIEIFGPISDIGELAAAAGTVAYELLTSVGQRVRRCYVDEVPAG